MSDSWLSPHSTKQICFAIVTRLACWLATTSLHTNDIAATVTAPPPINPANLHYLYWWQSPPLQAGETFRLKPMLANDSLPMSAHFRISQPTQLNIVFNLLAPYFLSQQSSHTHQTNVYLTAYLDQQLQWRLDLGASARTNGIQLFDEKIGVMFTKKDAIHKELLLLRIDMQFSPACHDGLLELHLQTLARDSALRSGLYRAANNASALLLVHRARLRLVTEVFFRSPNKERAIFTAGDALAVSCKVLHPGDAGDYRPRISLDCKAAADSEHATPLLSSSAADSSGDGSLYIGYWTQTFHLTADCHLQSIRIRVASVEVSRRIEVHADPTLVELGGVASPDELTVVLRDRREPPDVKQILCLADGQPPPRVTWRVTPLSKYVTLPLRNSSNRHRLPSLFRVDKGGTRLRILPYFGSDLRPQPVTVEGDQGALPLAKLMQFAVSCRVPLPALSRRRARVVELESATLQLQVWTHAPGLSGDWRLATWHDPLSEAALACVGLLAGGLLLVAVAACVAHRWVRGSRGVPPTIPASLHTSCTARSGSLVSTSLGSFQSGSGGGKRRVLVRVGEQV